jgi:hypothetical protein
VVCVCVCESEKFVCGRLGWGVDSCFILELLAGLDLEGV